MMGGATLRAEMAEGRRRLIQLNASPQQKEALLGVAQCTTPTVTTTVLNSTDKNPTP